MFIAAFVSQISLAAQIGYGFSDAVLPAKNQELFYVGFEAGAGEVLGVSNLKDTISLVRITDGSQLGAVKAAEQLLAIKEVVMMAGFPTSHEALLVASLPRIVGGCGFDGCQEHERQHVKQHFPTSRQRTHAHNHKVKFLDSRLLS